MGEDKTQNGKPAGPCVMVIFGSSGDLTKRKLIPALYNLHAYGLLDPAFSVIGVARREGTTDSFRANMSAALKEFATRDVDQKLAGEFIARLEYLKGNFDEAGTFEALKARIGESNCLFYLATPPEHFVPIVNGLGAAGLAQEEKGKWRRVIIEKPFGRDLDSARDLSAQISKVLAESQIYRIDHYLGKETVQNLLVFRFGNGIFEPIWNRRYIDHVQITVAEDIGIEGRGNYYETAGVLRDVVQNHMFMLMSLVAMEPPTSLKGESVRNEKTKVFEAVLPMTPEQVMANTVRGQYGPGKIGGKDVPGYRQEPNVAPDSDIETFAALKLEIANWRWSGVPFYLRSGKRLAKRSTEIVITFRPAPLMLYGHKLMDRIGPNRLIMHVQPCEGITLQVRAKTPGPRMLTQAVGLEFNYEDLQGNVKATGYETLLYDCMTGDPTLFHRTDTVEAAWKIATPILDAWEQNPPKDFPNYASGTWGPLVCNNLIEKKLDHWWDPSRPHSTPCS